MGFAVPVAEFAGEGEGLLVVFGGLLVAALSLVDEAEVVQRVGFAVPVAEFAGEGEGLLVVFGGLSVAALLLVDEAEVA